MHFERIWAMADIHGSYLPIENFYRKHKDNINFSPETDCIILLGDVGANFYLNKTDIKFKKKLCSFPFTYFCIRGNHESRVASCVDQYPADWEIEIFFDDEIFIEKEFPQIKYARDDITVYNINNFKTLVIPGAYSVDKYYRLENHWPWFKDEQLSSQEMEEGRRIIKRNNNKFDLILSHTCPICYEPTDLFLSNINQSLVDKTMERYLGEIEYIVSYKLWLWGHYHAYRVYPKYQEKQCIMLSAGQEVINVLDWLNNPQKIYAKW